MIAASFASWVKFFSHLGFLSWKVKKVNSNFDNASTNFYILIGSKLLSFSQQFSVITAKDIWLDLVGEL